MKARTYVVWYSCAPRAISVSAGDLHNTWVVDLSSVRGTYEERVAIMQEKLSMPADIIHDLLSVAGSTIVVIADDSHAGQQRPVFPRST